jgi:hypothetical protein
MRILIPYTVRHFDTIAGAPPYAEWVDVSATASTYWEVLCDFWAHSPDGLLVIEHDVVCRPDVVESVTQCPKPWCAYPYSGMCHWACMEAWRNTLGCTRFSAALMRANPDGVSRIEEPHRDWHNLCDGIGDNLRAAGWTHHWHRPEVIHHKMNLGHLAALIGA